MSPIEATETVDLQMVVNGVPVVRAVPARRLLVDVIRDDLGLTGTHIGCEHGICGACTVLVDGQPSRSCTLLAFQVDGSEITTIEGLGREGLHRLQAAFKEHHALQCGFCTPGVLLSVVAADSTDFPGDSGIRELLAGNLCRCTGYQQIVHAVRSYWGRT